MAETEISKINNRICEKIIIFKIINLLIDWPDDSRSDNKSDNSKWPIIFAVKQIDKGSNN